MSDRFDGEVLSSIKEAGEELDITIGDELAENILAWVQGCYENKGMLDGSPPDKGTPRCEKCESLARDVADLESQVGIFRKSVAERRNVSAGDVYTEDGRVMYDP